MQKMMGCSQSEQSELVSPPSVSKIQPIQHRKMRAIASSLDMDDDKLHMVVQGVTGLGSIRALDSQQAENVIAELQVRQKVAGIVPPRPKRQKKPDTAVRPGGVTKAQQGKMWALLGELEKLDDAAGKPKGDRFKRLSGIIKKATETKQKPGIDAPPANLFVWLKMEDGITVIDYLKRLVASEETKAIREGRVKHV